MVQVLPGNKKSSFSEGLLSGFSESIPNAVNQLIERRDQAEQMRQQQASMAQENEALAKLGINVGGVQNPKLREIITQEGLRPPPSSSAEAKKLAPEYVQTVKDTFGEKFGNLYEAASEGGKSELIKFGLEARQRGKDVQSLLQNPDNYNAIANITTRSTPNETPTNTPVETPAPIPTQKTSPAPEKIDYDAGLTPKEKVARQDKRYVANEKKYSELQSNLDAYRKFDETTDILTEINDSGALPSGIGRWNVNTKEGTLKVPAAANAETQQYVKTVNEFMSGAQNTYGGKVSNFEAAQFMQRLPTLANTQEGRRLIIRQMKYLSDINKIHDEELEKVFDEHGGIRYIDYDVAERLAKKRAKPLIEDYKNEYKSAEKQSKQLFDSQIEDMKSKTPPDHFLTIKDGQLFFIPKKNYFRANKQGYKKI